MIVPEKLELQPEEYPHHPTWLPNPTLQSDQPAGCRRRGKRHSRPDSEIKPRTKNLRYIDTTPRTRQSPQPRCKTANFHSRSIIALPYQATNLLTTSISLRSRTPEPQSHRATVDPRTPEPQNPSAAVGPQCNPGSQLHMYSQVQGPGFANCNASASLNTYIY